MTKPERKAIEDARKAVCAEWQGLRDSIAWREDDVEERHAAKARHAQIGKIGSLGKPVEIRVTQHSELTDENCKIAAGRNGRVCFMGNDIRDEHGFHVEFHDQGSIANYGPLARHFREQWLGTTCVFPMLL